MLEPGLVVPFNSWGLDSFGRSRWTHNSLLQCISQVFCLSRPLHSLHFVERNVALAHILDHLLVSLIERTFFIHRARVHYQVLRVRVHFPKSVSFLLVEVKFKEDSLVLKPF